MKFISIYTAIAAAILFSAPPTSASACPDKSYVKQYDDDDRRTMSASYWVYEVKDEDTDSLYRRLINADALGTYNKVSKEREPDFQCVFATSGKNCTNSAGHSWDPIFRYSDKPAYTMNYRGDPELQECRNTDGCGAIFVDKIGTRFRTDRIFWDYKIDVHHDRVYIPDVYATSVIKDGAHDLTLEVVVLRKLFSGEKNRHYVAISREIVTGYYCTYQERVFPKL